MCTPGHSSNMAWQGPTPTTSPFTGKPSAKRAKYTSRQMSGRFSGTRRPTQIKHTWKSWLKAKKYITTGNNNKKQSRRQKQLRPQGDCASEEVSATSAKVFYYFKECPLPHTHSHLVRSHPNLPSKLLGPAQRRVEPLQVQAAAPNLHVREVVVPWSMIQARISTRGSF